MAGRCPHLGLQGNQYEVFLVSSSRNRCYAGGRPERVGAEFQSATCLTSAYRRCPRLTMDAKGRVWLTSAMEKPTAAGADDQPLEPTSKGWPAGRYTDLSPLPMEQKVQPRRSWRAAERAVLGLGLSIVLASLFIGFALVYRLRVGPGMEAAAAIARGTPPGLSEALPLLTPAAEPAASCTPVALAVTPTLPTSIPEPALPVSTSYARPPAMSPPTRLVIPKIALDIPVVPVGTKSIQEGGTVKVVWADVPNAAGFHQTSAYPGNPGNTVINGHRDMLGAVFRYLDRLAEGDEVILYVGQVAYPYLVTETLVVPETFASAEQRAENLRLIGYLPEERLTLVTCTPVGLATHRLLVIARPPAQAGLRMPEAGSGGGP